jgi:hypothetical protein
MAVQVALGWAALAYAQRWSRQKILTTPALEFRITIIGYFFVVFGIVMQLWASILDSRTSYP